MANEKNTVYLALGSNLGNRFFNIKDAIFRLFEFVTVREISSIEETEPVGFANQAKFLNCVIKGEATLSLRELFEATSEIEKNMGRVPNFEKGPRLIDIDILFFNNEIVNEQDLQVPHPRASERKFVIKPMAEISPDFRHPSLDKTMKELLKDLKA